MFWNLLFFLKGEGFLVFGRGLRGAKRIKCKTCCWVLRFTYNCPKGKGTSCLCARLPDLFYTMYSLQITLRVSL